MKIFSIAILICLSNTFFTSKNNIFTPHKLDIEIKKQLQETGLYSVSVYNNSDSVLCFITSSFGKYKKDSISELIPWTKTADSLVYKIDYTLGDTKFDPFLPIRNKVCILPYQEINFNIKLSEVKPNMILNFEYFYSHDYNFPKSQAETKKPLWYNKYQRQFISTKIP